MSRIIDEESLFVFSSYLNYLNEHVLIISVCGSVAILIIRTNFNASNERIEFNYNPVDDVTFNYIINYFFINLTFLMTNVAMETSYKAEARDAARLDVIIVGLIGISLVIIVQVLISRKTKIYQKSAKKIVTNS